MGGRGASSSENGNKLPKLEGSEKQIKWANDIRNTMMQIRQVEEKAFLKHKDIFTNETNNAGFNYEQAYKDYKKYSKEVFKEKSAKKWIDNFRTANTGYKLEFKEEFYNKGKYRRMLKNAAQGYSKMVTGKYNSYFS